MKYIPIIAASLLVLSFSGSAQSSIISGSHTVNGRTVNLSGLEWLSFDDTLYGSTFNTSTTDILASGSSWSLAGWEYATADQVAALFNSIVTSGARTATHAPGIDWLMANWGSKTVDANETDFDNDGVVVRTAFDRVWGMYSTLAPALPGYSLSFLDTGWIKDFNDGNADIGAQTITPFARIFDQVWDGSANMNVGSWLVRAAVPEPSIIALFALGLFGLGFARRRKA